MRARNTAPAIASFVLIFFVIAGCSLDYGTEDEEMEESIPNIVFNEAVFTDVSNGSRVYRVEVKKASNYETREEIVLEDAYFFSYDSQGVIQTEGKAGRILGDTASEDTDLRGDILIKSYTEKAEISSEDLSWKAEPRILSGKAETVVRIKKENGTILRGKGFSADFSINEITYSKGAEGVYVTDDENE